MNQPVERGPQRRRYEQEEPEAGAPGKMQARHSTVDDLQDQILGQTSNTSDQPGNGSDGFQAGDQKRVANAEVSTGYHQPPPFFTALSPWAAQQERAAARAVRHSFEVTQRAPEAYVPAEIVSLSVAALIEDDPRSFLRVTVMHEDRRGDLLLPGNIPLAEITPTLVRRFTSLTPRKVTQGFVLVRADGTTLAPGKSLLAHGVTDGTVLSLASRVKERDKKYDDIVEAVADAAEEFNKPWTPQNTATTALSFMAVLVLASLFVLFQIRSEVGIVVPIVTGVIAALHIGLAWVLQGAGRAWHAVMIALLGSVAAGITGLTISGGALDGLPAVFGGLAAALVAALALPLLRQWRELLFIPIVVGTVVAVIFGLHIAFEVGIPTICVALAGLIGIAVLAVPQISIRLAGLNTTKDRIDSKQTKELYARGHRLWVSLWIGAALTLVLVAIPAVQTGKYGVVLMVLNAVLLAMGSRKSFARIDVLLQYVGALAVFVVTAVSTVLLYPAWWYLVVVALLLVIIATAAFGLILGRTWPWTKRVVDIAESAAGILLIPATVLAMGLW